MRLGSSKQPNYIGSKVAMWVLSTDSSDFNAQDLQHKMYQTHFVKFPKIFGHQLSLPKISLPYIRKVPDLMVTKKNNNNLTNYLFRSISPNNYALLFFIQVHMHTLKKLKIKYSSSLSLLCCDTLLNTSECAFEGNKFSPSTKKYCLTVGLEL